MDERAAGWGLDGAAVVGTAAVRGAAVTVAVIRGESS